MAKGKSLAVKSAVKALVGKNCRVAGDFFKGLDDRIAWKVKRAVERAKANGRKTVRAYDL